MKIVGENNITDLLEESQLREIGDRVKRTTEFDDASRKDWMDLTEEAMKIAKQVYEEKNTPFEGASNIKYPLIAEAIYEYGSRAGQEVLREDNVVKFKIIGPDKKEEKQQRVQRLSHFLNYHFMYEQKKWSQGVDKALHVLPMVGTVHRKIYFCPIKKHIVCELCNYKDIIIHNKAKSLEEAPRITHRIYKSRREVLSNQRLGLWADVDLEELDNKTPNAVRDMDTNDSMEDDDRPYAFLEQHNYLDLDGDGYPEPYIVIVHENTGKVVKIAPRFDAKNIDLNEKNKVIHIKADNYFIDWHCMPSPDGSYWSVGFGQILYPLNEAINSILNNLVDAGTLNNHQSGLLPRTFRTEEDTMEFEMGQWTFVDVPSGMKLKDSIVPLPTKEPSATLFQLLGLLIEVGKDLSSITDVLQGKGPSQNVPATTISTLEKQGLTLYTAMQKRLYNGMKNEFCIVFEMLKDFTDKKKYEEIVEAPVPMVKYENYEIIADFDDRNYDIIPVFDPTVASDTQKMIKLQQFATMPAANPVAITQRAQHILQLEGDDLIMPPPPPSADDKLKEAQAQLAAAEQALTLAKIREIESKIQLAPLSQAETMSRIQESKARSENMSIKSYLDNRKLDIQEANVALDHDVNTAKTMQESAKIAQKSKDQEIQQSEVLLKYDTDKEKNRVARDKGMAKPSSK